MSEGPTVWIPAPNCQSVLGRDWTLTCSQWTWQHTQWPQLLIGVWAGERETFAEHSVLLWTEDVVSFSWQTFFFSNKRKMKCGGSFTCALRQSDHFRRSFGVVYQVGWLQDGGIFPERQWQVWDMCAHGPCADWLPQNTSHHCFHTCANIGHQTRTMPCVSCTARCLGIQSCHSNVICLPSPLHLNRLPNWCQTKEIILFCLLVGLRSCHGGLGYRC